MSRIISCEKVRLLVDGWIAEGKRVIGPRAVKAAVTLYGDLSSSTDLLLDSAARPANSIKEAVFARHEALYRYRLEGKQVQLLEVPLPAAEQIVIGARPCDAAALAILDHVFNWDFRDEQYNHRRERTTVVTLACGRPDVDCFCTSVGGGPDDPRGSDAMLLDLGDGSFELREFTEKGRRLMADHATPSEKTGQAVAPLARAIDLEAIRAWLAGGFDRAEWPSTTLRCLGCGACAHACPTCHCFDIVDEGNASGGTRSRNWDACQFATFTLHASGHNPRNKQWQRQRQRIYHKFVVYPEKFGPLLCTGCGNCARNCPVGLGVLPVLEAIQVAAETASVGQKCQG